MSNEIRTPVCLRQVARSKRLHAQSARAYLSRLDSQNIAEREECEAEIEKLELEAWALETEATQLEQQP